MNINWDKLQSASQSTLATISNSLTDTGQISTIAGNLGMPLREGLLRVLPEVSIVRSLLNQGLDIFATDWGTPSAYDESLTIEHFVEKYLDKSVDSIREITNSDKVSLFGYCWGGDLALMYAATHPEKVKNLITVATPGDFDLDLYHFDSKFQRFDMFLEVYDLEFVINFYKFYYALIHFATKWPI